MRRDRPGYQFRTNRDGSIAHYWNPVRASKVHGVGLEPMRLPNDLTDDELVERCQRLTADLRGGPSPEKVIDRKRKNISEQLFKMYRKRARDIGKPFDLPNTWMYDRLKEIGDKCEVGGVSFNYEPQPRARKRYFKHPLRPSLDRIDNDGGYSISNVRFVLHCVNIGLNEWGLDNYIAVCTAVASYHRGPFPDLTGPDGKLLMSTDW